MTARLALGFCLVMIDPTIGQAGVPSFEGSTVVSARTNFQPELIYKKFPTTVPVVPNVSWRLGFGILIDSAPATIAVTLSLDPAGQNANVQIVDGSATFAIQGALNSNYDPLEQFEIMYTGALNPFMGPIDFLLTPSGLGVIPVRVHLNVVEHAGFPVPLSARTATTAPVGDIVGDQNLEIVVQGLFAGERSLHAFDQSGALLAGWPFRLDDADILEQTYFVPAIVDMDRDGKDEVLTVGTVLRNVPGQGSVNFTSLFALDGAGTLLWQASDDILAFSTPAVADIDGDAALDIIVGGGANLLRYDKNGTLVAGWRVETLNDISVRVPIIANIDGNRANGLEIIAVSFVPGSPGDFHLYVWNQDGSLHGPAWPKLLDDGFAPVVVDLDGDPTNGREIVMAVDHASPDVDPQTGFLNTFTVFAWHEDGTDVNGWPHRFMRDPNLIPDDRVPASPSVADIDGDGDMEVIVGTYGQGDPANGNLFVFHHDGTLDPNWPQWAGTAQTPDVFGGRALGDLDNDGKLEIVTGSFTGVFVFRSDGSQYEGFPRLTGENFAQPMIADLDRDGRMEIVQISRLASLSVWTVLTPSPGPDPWPRFRQNPARTGTPDRVFLATVPTLSAIGLFAMCCLLLGAGAYVIRRSAQKSAS